MSKRIDGLKQILKKKIINREPGFLESIPSIRELVADLGESRHVVTTALKELEDENLLLCTPQKGFRVNPAIRVISEEGYRKKSHDLEIIFTETMPWQVESWEGILKIFMEEHPQQKIGKHFTADPEKAENILRSAGDTPVIIVRAPDSFLKKDRKPILLSEIERFGGSLFDSSDLFPGLLHNRNPETIPYQLQPSILFYTHQKDGSAPDTSSWLNLMKWCGKHYGPRSILPVHSTFMLKSLGLLPESGLPEDKLIKKLTKLSEILSFVWKNQLYNVTSSSLDRFDEVRKHLASGIVIRNSFYAGSLRDKPVEFHATPLEDGGSLDMPTCQLALFAPECTQTAAEFIRFLVSERIQLHLMRENRGISPFRSITKQVVDSPKDFRRGLDSIAKQILELSPEQLCFDAPENANSTIFMTNLLTDRFFLPYLSGGTLPKSEFKALTQEILDYYKEHQQKQYLKTLRSQLLRN